MVSRGFFTYQSLFSDVIKAASAMRKLGIKRGDKVMLHMPNIPELVIFYARMY